MDSASFFYKINRAWQLAIKVMGRLLRGHWNYYTIFAGTNTLSEAGLALLSLLGKIPLVDGSHIKAYERRFSEVVGTRYAFSFAAGRMGLYALLEALDIGQGDEVILPAFTCVVVPNAILYRGARPVFVDIEPYTFNIDVSQIEKKITPRTRAIIAQHTFGLVCEMDKIMSIAQRHNLLVLEDCAHALGAQWNGRPVGSLGTAAYFSTDHTKVIGTGTGGMVTTNDDVLAEKIRIIYEQSAFLPRSRLVVALLSFALEAILFHPRLASIGRVLYGILFRLGLCHGYFMDELSLSRPTAYPFPARLSNAQSIIGLSQLNRLPQNLAYRRLLAELFEAELGQYGPLLKQEYTNNAFLRYTFLVNNRQAWEDLFEDILRMDVWFTSVVHGRNSGLNKIGYVVGSCPVAEFAALHCVNLPTHLRIYNPHQFVRLLRKALQSGNSDLRHLASVDPFGCIEPK